MYINRHIEPVLLRLLTQFKCVLISGPRQVGKSTLAKNLKEAVPRKYISLDNMDYRFDAKTNPKLFLETHTPPVCIDEIQYAPELFPYIKMIVDRNQRPGDYILIGSQIYGLMRGVSESLAGRAAILDLQGISQSEEYGLPNREFLPDLNAYRDRRPSRGVTARDVFTRIFNGSMPDVVSGNVADVAAYYSSYVRTYLERDVRDLNVANEQKFYRFITACAVRSGQILNVSNLARDADITLPSAQQWLNVLETLGLIFYLYPYSNNLSKRVVKKPKLYFYDTGLVCYLSRWNGVEAMMTGAASGALLETFVVSEIVKSYFNAGKRPYIYYYRDSDMKEIDLLVDAGQSLHPVEIKKASSVDRRIANTFKLIAKSGLNQGVGAVVCLNDGLSAIDRETLIIPVTAI
ncbi:MAG: ATP-binding protein [Clostridiales bacterium]|jgi:predicted AAA+ superfamily ATPase|nr:ATP-binding protein [Clostridiales bacterium]